MLSPDSLTYPYPSRRSAVFGRRGMVATGQPLAAQVGLDMLKRGGNAIDAAIATAATLTVVEPTSCGIGGDAFALVWVKGQLHGLNASGPAPARLDPETVRQAGYDSMPLYGWFPVTVPGLPAAWAALSNRFGKLPFEQLLAPAIELAEQGFPVSPTVSDHWQQEARRLHRHLQGEATRGWFETFTLGGRAPLPGEIFRCPEQASTLRELAATNSESFYRGELADHIDAFSRRTGGYLRKADLARYRVEWVQPIKAQYKGVDVWEIPPNGQGMVALMALNILKGMDVTGRDNLDTLHRQIEAMKLAYTDGRAYITQADRMRVEVAALLSDAYAAERRALIGPEARPPSVGTPSAGGTVYLASADDEGNMVSFIQSNYHGFGAGVVVPGTGIALQNRGNNFSLDPSHPNCLAPGKKTFHTIIPGFLTQNGQPLGPFGVMGGFMQPQGHVQVVMNLVDFGLNPQAALDAPRWQWLGGMKVGVEQGYPNHLVKGLVSRGHEVEMAFDPTDYGRGQIILRDLESGVYCGGTEPRTDGTICAW